MAMRLCFKRINAVIYARREGPGKVVYQGGFQDSFGLNAAWMLVFNFRSYAEQTRGRDGERALTAG